jgi:hypothetical protein
MGGMLRNILILGVYQYKERTEMTNDILKTIGRQKHMIVLAVAILAVASYIFPIDSMYDLADAQRRNSNGNHNGNNGNHNGNNGNNGNSFSFTARNTAENRCTGPGTTCLAGAQQTLLFPSGFGGNSPSTLNNGNTGSFSISFTFENTASNRCSGGAFCQAQAIQYGFFGST